MSGSESGLVLERAILNSSYSECFVHFEHFERFVHFGLLQWKGLLGLYTHLQHRR